MIFFRTLKWKNLLSTGNQWTEVDFTTSKTTLIVGTNGAGKSTMLDALSFALFGKAFRNINKPQLINSTNQKNLEVEIEFDAHNASYLVRRGLKPSLFEIFKNGELVSTDAAIKDYQAYLEKNVLKMNFKTFGQVVVLGSSTYVPFMQLPAAARREVIEDLLDIQVFTTMSNLLKEKIGENKAELLSQKHGIELLTSKLQDAKKHNDEIRSLKQFEVEKLKTKAKDLFVELQDADKGILELEASIEGMLELIEDKKDVKDQITKFDEMMNILEMKKKQILKDSAFFTKHDNCPTCLQGIDHDFKTEKLSDYQDSLNDIDSGLEQIAIKMLKVKARLNEISDVEDQMAKMNLEAGSLRATKKIITSNIKSLKAELTSAQKNVAEIDQSSINELRTNLDKMGVAFADLTSHKEILATATAILKDGGIKTQIIKQFIPVMNKLINRYLASLEFLVDFELDSEFNETIKSRFRDVFSYSSFSEGEKLRIDISLMLAWRTVAKMRNSLHTNLLILDEVFDGSADVEGVEGIMSMLNELDSSVFVISHKSDQMNDKFERVIRFEKVKGFSQMAA